MGPEEKYFTRPGKKGLAFFEGKKKKKQESEIQRPFCSFERGVLFKSA
jgi:hypothetical protein